MARRLLGLPCMSFLDMDERLLTVAGLRADLVYSPLVDAKEFPADVDVTLVEGAVSSEEDLHKIKLVRERTKILVSLGDCAVTANVPGMRNPFGVKAVRDRAYRENASRSIPVHSRTGGSGAVGEFRVRCTSLSPWTFLYRGRPPSADTIYCCEVSELLEGRTPDVRQKTRFGA